MRGVVAVLSVSSVLAASPLAAGQTCDSSTFPLSSPASRFVDHGDGTVTDVRSKLMWMRCSVGQTWGDGHCAGDARALDLDRARATAAEVNRDGRFFFNDWRVPQLRELATIAERECSAPRINLAVCPDTPAAAYWAATARAGSGREPLAYQLDFGADGIRYATADQASHVRLVRTDR